MRRRFFLSLALLFFGVCLSGCVSLKFKPQSSEERTNTLVRGVGTSFLMRGATASTGK